MKEKRRLTVNIVAQIVSFAVSMGINFLLTPFIVNKLGAGAYGFIGLSNNFITYAQIITIALNSMAGRFIAIEYLRGNLLEAKKYYTSVFFANLFLSVVIGLIAILTTFYLEFIIEIPADLLFDVKLLFTLLVGNFVCSLIFSVFGVATFIKNRLDYAAIVSVIGNILKAAILAASFAFLTPRLWYVGCASIFFTLFVGLSKFFFKLFLTSDLQTSTTLYDNHYVFSIVKSGIWFSVSRLSNVLEQGFDLLFANLFIGVTAMGHLSITKQIPVMILALVGTISSAFAPSLTDSFAKYDRERMKSEILTSVKIIGFFALIPLCFIFSYADCFYSLWLPNQDSKELYYLTIIGIAYFPILLSLEGVQNLWPVVDKVKFYSLASITSSSLTFITLFSGISFIDEAYRIYYLVSVSTFFNFIFVIFFIPMFAAFCLEEKKTFFYPNIVKILISFSVVVAILLCFKVVFIIDSWYKLCLALTLTILLCGILGSILILNSKDREVIRARLVPLLLKCCGKSK